MAEQRAGRSGRAAEHASDREVRRLAQRAVHFLKGHPKAAGSTWGQLALAARRGDGPAGAAGKLLGPGLDELHGTRESIAAT